MRIPGRPGTLSSVICAVATAAVCPALLAQQVRQVRLGPPMEVAQVQFTQVTSVRELADGSLLVADRRENRLVHVEWSNREYAVVGREGDGPGEYRSVGWLYPLGGDSTLFTDPRSGRWNLLHGGRIVESIPPHSPLLRTFPSQSRIAGTDSAGHVLDLVSPEGTIAGESTADSLLLILGSRRTGTFDTLRAIRGFGGRGFQIQPRPGGGTDIIVTNPLAARDDAILSAGGWVAIAHVDPYRVSWRTPQGSWIDGEPLPFPTIKVDRSEKCHAWERFFGDARPCRPSDLRGWPDELPPFLPSAEPILFISPGGRLVVARLPHFGQDGHEYDIIDRGGDLVATLTLPLNEWIIGFGRSAVYTTSTDLLGLQSLRRIVWPL